MNTLNQAFIRAFQKKQAVDTGADMPASLGSIRTPETVGTNDPDELKTPQSDPATGEPCHEADIRPATASVDSGPRTDRQNRLRIDAAEQSSSVPMPHMAVPKVEEAQTYQLQDILAAAVTQSVWVEGSLLTLDDRSRVDQDVPLVSDPHQVDTEDSGAAGVTDEPHLSGGPRSGIPSKHGPVPTEGEPSTESVQATTLEPAGSPIGNPSQAGDESAGADPRLDSDIPVVRSSPDSEREAPASDNADGPDRPNSSDPQTESASGIDDLWSSDDNYPDPAKVLLEAWAAVAPIDRQLVAAMTIPEIQVVAEGQGPVDTGDSSVDVAALHDPQQSAELVIDVDRSLAVELAETPGYDAESTESEDRHEAERETPDERESTGPTETDPLPAAPPFAASWEVDAFPWPGVAIGLDDVTQGRLRDAGRQLAMASREGLGVLAVTSVQRGEGRTTLALSLARAAAQSGLRVALLDADLARPELASQLGIETPCDWEELAREHKPINEAAIHSLADGVTLFPKRDAWAGVGDRMDGTLLNGVLHQLTPYFDLVLVDLPPMADAHRDTFAELPRCPLDMAVVVRDLRTTGHADTLPVVQTLETMGVPAIGIVENFEPVE